MKISTDKLVQFAMETFSRRASDLSKPINLKAARETLRASVAMILCQKHPDVRTFSNSNHNPYFRRHCKSMIRWSCKHVAEKYSAKGPLPIDDVLTAAAYITLLQLVEEVGTV